MIGHFSIDALIDEGNVLNVYRAFDTKRHRQVAIEIPNERAGDPKRFLYEAKRVANVKHPNIIEIFEVNAVKGIPYIVAELVAGTNLDQHLMQHRDNTAQAMHLIAQIADGLQAAHEHAIVHRDLKPTNILVTDLHQVKIVDFGMPSTKGEPPDWSLHYQAPEERHVGPITAAADIFSLGLVAYEVLTGTKPSRAHRDAIAHEELPGVPNDVKPLIAQMLAIDPRERPTAIEASRAFHRLGTLPHVRTLRSTEAVQVQCPDLQAYRAALAHATAERLNVTVASDRRWFFSVDVVSDADRQHLDTLKRQYGAELVEDYQYDRDYDVFDGAAVLPDDAAAATLNDVLQQIKARDAWRISQGAGVVIAIIDTGIEGSRPEFPPARRAGEWHAFGEDAWTDDDGHGTMCATIATANTAEFTGVAPNARIISCKVNYRDSQLALAYDYLTDLAEGGMTIVASNSWGTKTGTPPERERRAQFPRALQRALDAGVIVVCSAGNYHDLVTGATECGPTSIWLHKSRADVLTVGTCKLNGAMWAYSSRGPGQDFGQPNTSSKPDVTAPTPENGRILYGKHARTLRDGWGTSGAAPQVAGLAALILAKSPGIPRAALFDAIRDSADRLPSKPHCCGAGMINCGNAVRRV